MEPTTWKYGKIARAPMNFPGSTCRGRRDLAKRPHDQPVGEREFIVGLETSVRPPAPPAAVASTSNRYGARPSPTRR